MRILLTPKNEVANKAMQIDAVRAVRLHRTVEVVDKILGNKRYLEQLYDCYFSEDEVVRLRTSNAFKRISREKPEWLVPYLDRFLGEISKIDQASTQWTLANLFETLREEMTKEQVKKAETILKKNLKSSNDWIVLKNSMQTLNTWSTDKKSLRTWLEPELVRLSKDPRKAVSGFAKKSLKSQ